MRYEMNHDIGFLTVQALGKVKNSVFWHQEIKEMKGQSQVRDWPPLLQTYNWIGDSRTKKCSNESA